MFSHFSIGDYKYLGIKNLPMYYKDGALLFTEAVAFRPGQIFGDLA